MLCAAPPEVILLKMAIYVYILTDFALIKLNLWTSLQWFVLKGQTLFQDVKKFKVADPRRFHYLNQTNCYEVANVDDAREYIETRKAMDIVGISQEEQVIGDAIRLLLQKIKVII